MKRPARWLIPLALLGCALAWWWSLPPAEPTHEGVPLSQWMRDHKDDVLIYTKAQPPLPHSRTAIQWLTYTAEYGQSTHRKAGLIETLFGRRKPMLTDSVFDERSSAMEILGSMGSAAEPAIPALLRVLKDDSYGYGLSAAEVLQRIGPDSWPVVEDQLSHGSNLVRCHLLKTLWVRMAAYQPYEFAARNDDARVFKLFTQALRDPEPNIRRNAATSLALVLENIAPGPIVDQTAAVLWPLPDESNPEVRNAKRSVLNYYRSTIADTVPRLTAMMTDPDEVKQKFARTVLDQLAAPSTSVEAP